MGGECLQQIEEVLIHQGTHRGDAIGPRSISRPEGPARPLGGRPRIWGRLDRVPPARSTRERPSVTGDPSLCSHGHYSRVSAAPQPRRLLHPSVLLQRGDDPISRQAEHAHPGNARRASSGPSMMSARRAAMRVRRFLRMPVADSCQRHFNGRRGRRAHEIGLVGS